jgi:3-oxoacyl-[acyl-carrier protein] reductase
MAEDNVNASKTALVTGASRGIGAAVARRLSQDGFAVLLNYARSAEEAEAVVGKIRASGGQAIAVQGDVADPAVVSSLFDRAEQAFGGVAVLVNNAGVMRLSPIAQVSDSEYELIVNTNLRGVFNGMREAAKRLPDGGRIINFSSTVVGLYGATYGIYAATKAAVEAMTHVVSKELGPRGINVNVIAPGPVETDMFMDGKSEELVARITGMIPFGRLGQPDDIADVVSFLAGPDSRWITGQVLRVNGGLM